MDIIYGIELLERCKQAISSEESKTIIEIIRTANFAGYEYSELIQHAIECKQYEIIITILAEQGSQKLDSHHYFVNIQYLLPKWSTSTTIVSEKEQITKVLIAILAAAKYKLTEDNCYELLLTTLSQPINVEQLLDIIITHLQDKMSLTSYLRIFEHLFRLSSVNGTIVTMLLKVSLDILKSKDYVDLIFKLLRAHPEQNKAEILTNILAIAKGKFQKEDYLKIYQELLISRLPEAEVTALLGMVIVAGQDLLNGKDNLTIAIKVLRAHPEQNKAEILTNILAIAKGKFQREDYLEIYQELLISRLPEAEVTALLVRVIVNGQDLLNAKDCIDLVSKLLQAFTLPNKAEILTNILAIAKGKFQREDYLRIYQELLTSRLPEAEVTALLERVIVNGQDLLRAEDYALLTTKVLAGYLVPNKAEILTNILAIAKGKFQREDYLRIYQELLTSRLPEAEVTALLERVIVNGQDLLRAEDYALLTTEVLAGYLVPNKAEVLTNILAIAKSKFQREDYLKIYQELLTSQLPEAEVTALLGRVIVNGQDLLNAKDYIDLVSKLLQAFTLPNKAEILTNILAAKKLAVEDCEQLFAKLKLYENDSPILFNLLLAYIGNRITNISAAAYIYVFSYGLKNFEKLTVDNRALYLELLTLTPMLTTNEWGKLFFEALAINAIDELQRKMVVKVIENFTICPSVILFIQQQIVTAKKELRIEYLYLLNFPRAFLKILDICLENELLSKPQLLQLYNKFLEKIELSVANSEGVLQLAQQLSFANIITILKIAIESQTIESLSIKLQAIFIEKLTILASGNNIIWQRLLQEYQRLSQDPKANKQKLWIQYCDLVTIFEEPGTIKSGATNLCGIVALLNLLSFRAPNRLIELYLAYLHKNEASILPLKFATDDASYLGIHLQLAGAIKRAYNDKLGYNQSFKIAEWFTGITGPAELVSYLEKIGGREITEDVTAKTLHSKVAIQSILGFFGKGVSKVHHEHNYADINYLRQLLGSWHIFYLDIEKFEALGIGESGYRLSVEGNRGIVAQIIQHYVIGKLSEVTANNVTYEIYDQGCKFINKVSISEFLSFYLGGIQVKQILASRHVAVDRMEVAAMAPLDLAEQLTPAVTFVASAAAPAPSVTRPELELANHEFEAMQSSLRASSPKP